MSECGNKSVGPAGTFYCEKAIGHDGDHGAMPFTEWNVTWPTGEARGACGCELHASAHACGIRQGAWTL